MKLGEFLSALTNGERLHLTLKITSDPEGPPPHNNQSKYDFSSFDKEVIELELSKLITKSVIVPSCHEKGEVISPIFDAPKKMALIA